MTCQLPLVPLGSLTLTHQTADREQGKMAFILSWQIDATIGDAVESPTVEPPINPDCKPKTLSWKLMLTKKDAMYELTVCENGCSDRTTFLKCQKK